MDKHIFALKILGTVVKFQFPDGQNFGFSLVFSTNHSEKAVNLYNISVQPFDLNY